jgi:outer membrane receptor protein involved in Fe transport
MEFMKYVRVLQRRLRTCGYICGYTAITFLIISPTQAQQNLGTVAGSVIDKSSGKPLEGADVTLHRNRDSSVVKGTSTDASGKFVLSELPPGRFFLKAGMVGYNAAVVSGIAITSANPTLNLKPIQMSSSDVTTEEITVEGEKPMVEFKPDKKIFNVSKELTTSGGTLIDLLKNIPSVTVDQDGNVSLRGGQNVRIQIDGKPFGLEGPARNKILEQIPAANVESIELITNPSAKYEAEGSQGIINIVLKKSQPTGYNGTLTLNAGTGDKYSGFANLNWRNKGLNLFGNYNYSLNNFTMSGFSDRTNFYSPTSNLLSETGSGHFRMHSHFAKLGFDYSFDPKNTLTLSANLMKNERTRTENNFTRQFDVSGGITADYISAETDNDDGLTLDAVMNFTHKFDKPGHQISTDLTYSIDRDNETESIEVDYTVPAGLLADLRRTTSKDRNWSFTGQVDYVLPLGKDSPKESATKLEAGYKGNYKNRDNDYLFERYNDSTSSYETDYGYTNHFVYKENIQAVYGIYTGKLGNLGYSVGTRVEGTFTNGDLVNTGQEFDKKYAGVFPSASVSYSLSKGTDIQVTYSRRLNRPRPRQLNPFVEIHDPNVLFTGNPDLNPEYTDSYEMSFIYFLPGISVTPTIFYRRTTDEISRLRTLIDSTRTLVTFVNYAKSESYGGELMVNANPFKWWSFNGTFSYFKRNVDAGNIAVGLENDGTSWTGRALTQVSFPFDFSLQLSYFYTGKRFIAQGYMEPFQSLDAALKKDFFDKKLTIALRVSDIFKTQKFRVHFDDASFAEIRERSRDSRVLFLNVSYNFGEQQKKPERRKRDGRDENGEDDFGF